MSQGAPLVTQFSARVSDRPEKIAMELERLLGTVVSHVEFGDNQLLEVMGSDHDGQARWQLSIRGSARFTFSHNSEGSSWLVEANFDAGGMVRSSERAMILAICGARVESFRIEEEGLFIRSDDGRGIEVAFELNEDGIVFTILPDQAHPSTCRLVLPAELDNGRSVSDAP
ncbi:hypothetical protein [Altericroceibacterium xinjiangense]|uniref:hypothetical protein n=1 Tax=Altericroceibacterium xinjiangense TaxID=762261 RepID=UPI000F7DC03E|nr:hypothetical protein [Altericroceibacterium xinjiangense]